MENDIAWRKRVGRKRERERRKQFIIKYGCEVNKYNKIK